MPNKIFSLIILLLSVAQYGCQVNETALSQPNATNTSRLEKLRSGLFDAFQTIKQGTPKKDDLQINADILTSLLSLAPLLKRTTTDQPDSFDKFFADDDDGLSFAKETSTKVPVQNKSSHNVQHIVKLSKKTPDAKLTSKRSGDIISQISESLRGTVKTRRSSTNISASQVKDDASDDVAIDRLLQVFDSSLLVKQWSELKESISDDCSQDITDYIDGLKQHSLWALKMDDASGRYTSAFYWGNNFWTGSADLCSALNQEDHPIRRRHGANRSNAVLEASWREETSMHDGGPPFDVAFYVAKLLLNTTTPNLIKNRRVVQLGMCLPYSCLNEDVRILVTRVKSNYMQVIPLGISSITHDRYDIFADITFIVLVGVSMFVSVLLAAGTAYDIYLTKIAKRNIRRAQNLNANTEEVSRNEHKLDIDGLPNVTMTAGKSIYNVNNNLPGDMAINSQQELTDTASTSTEEHQIVKLNIYEEIILSFSLKTNGAQILDRSVGPDTLASVHGLRTISMLWVVLGHTCIVIFKYSDNPKLRGHVEQHPMFQIIAQAAYSVDTFFCLGGLLVSFLYFRTSAKGSLNRLTRGRKELTANVLQFLGLIGYRFARLAAPYLFMLGVVQVTMKWFAKNSIFEPPTLDHENCANYWWRNILFINTLFPVEQMCMLWSWYLSDEFQFYALGAVILIVSIRHSKLACSAFVVFFISSLITTGYVSYTNNHIPSSDDPFGNFDKIYDKPWTRLGPYLVGMFTGWILFRTNLKIRMSKIWIAVGWTLSIGTMLFLVFGLYSTELNVFAAAIYSSLSHTLWASAVSWVIIACSSGYGGWVNSFLSYPTIYPLSRVTYCAYLVHPVVIRAAAMQLDRPLHMTVSSVIIVYSGLTVISYIFSFVISLAFEAPIVTMLKILSPHKRPYKV